MKPGLIIGVICGAILGAAVWFSLSDGEPAVAPVPEVTPRMPSPPRPMVQQELPPAPVAAPLPVEQPAAPVAVEARPNVPTREAPLAAPPPPTEVAEETPEARFRGLSRELDYADNLLGKKNPTLEEVRSANGVFARCVEVDPENERCNESLERSRIALTTLSRSRRLDPNLEGSRVFGPRDLPSRLPPRR